jgi:hypothetical protein
MNVRERHARYYLDYLRASPEDWHWFDIEWPQIQNAWKWVSLSNNSAAFVLDYVHTMRGFQSSLGIWRDLIIWQRRGLEAARALNLRKTEAVLIHNIGWGTYVLGQRPEALGYYEQALIIWTPGHLAF